ncbi:uncharacterized protein RBU33_002497 isoform 2-T2 [Hipposideros larvatus]
MYLQDGMSYQRSNECAEEVSKAAPPPPHGGWRDFCPPPVDPAPRAHTSSRDVLGQKPATVRRSTVLGLDPQEAGHREGQGETEGQKGSSETQTESNRGPGQLDTCSLPKTPILTPSAPTEARPKRACSQARIHPKKHTQRLTPSAQQVCVVTPGPRHQDSSVGRWWAWAPETSLCDLPSSCA